MASLAPPEPATIRHFSLASSIGVPGSGNVAVYYPPGYAASDWLYPVIYLLHGIGGSDRVWEKYGWLSLNDYEALIETRALPPCLIVAPDGGSFPMWIDSNRESRLNYFTYLTHLLPEWAEGSATKAGELRVLGGATHRAIAGWSMGGLGALHTAFIRPDLYRAAASHSGVVDLGRWVDRFLGDFPKTADFLATPAYREGDPILPASYRDDDPVQMARSPGFAERVAGLSLYLDAGAQDEYGMQQFNGDLHAALNEAGVAHEFALFPGGHADRLSERLKISLPWLGRMIA